MILREFYKILIDCPQKVKIDNAINITIEAYDYDEETISRNMDFEIITPSNATLNYSATSNPYTFSYTPTEWGLYTIKCGHSKKQFFVDGIKSYYFKTGTVETTLYYTDEMVTAKIYAPSVATTKHTNKTLATIPENINGLNLRPLHTIVQSLYGKKGIIMALTDGTLRIRNHQDSSTFTEYISIEWMRR